MIKFSVPVRAALLVLAIGGVVGLAGYHGIAYIIEGGALSFLFARGVRIWFRQYH